MADVIVIGLLIVAVIAAGWGLYRAKKKGTACLGCPDRDICERHKKNCNRE